MNGRPRHGLIGYGIKMYHPICPYSCRAVLSSSTLNCSHAMIMDGDLGIDTSVDCYATDDAFLKSMAWCINDRCPTLEAWEVEKYWYNNLPGGERHQPEPKWTYQETLSQIATSPTETLVYGDPLNVTALVSDEDYDMQYRAMTAFERSEVSHETYGIVLLVSGSVIPILASFLRFFPFPRRLASQCNAILIDPPLLGSRHKVPYFNMAVMPTRGQAMFIAYLVIINVVLSAVGYNSAQPSAWFSNRNGEILTYVANRVGVLSFANIPLLVLYAGRNNVLYWLTNWSQSTFILLHRWVAYICTLQAALHSILYLRIYLAASQYNAESKLAYWVWGIIATLCMSILLPASVIPVREKMYEVFLASHFVLALLALVGCYMHIYDRFQHQWGYEVWIYTGFAVWGFDRLMRLLRIARNGLRKAVITVLDEENIRVDISGVTGNGHAYLYFPTLTWRVWENHPFSITTPIDSTKDGRLSPVSSVDLESDIEKHRSGNKQVATTAASTRIAESLRNDPSIRLTFFLRTRAGTTSLLRNRIQLPVLVESDYLHHPDLSQYPNLVCIVGGVGITAVVPLLRSHPGRAKLYWSSRSQALVTSAEAILDGVDYDVVVSRRLDLRAVMEGEAGEGTGGMAVVVSGPAGMADSVRQLVAEFGRKSRRPIKLIEESFSW
ncbi:ferric reductase like transmembrane component [Polychaeton citri CBS 116435]|uniref:Ferric reductase like transmembrane component n=1 Tax=Polychaeton citri CBS 116435 TaxID=1314669 RepID=A0A9P4URN9_9PEZI|nr:ferric reductase like transmembrane component [Polychaeton citri CBS 116435]